VWNNPYHLRYFIKSAKSELVSSNPFRLNNFFKMALHIEDVVPIDVPKRKIKLIQLLPGHDNDAVKCTSHQYKLEDEHLDFAALSYTADDQTPAIQTIHIDGLEFKIRHNLWLFLKQARCNGIFSLLWIDAICTERLTMDASDHDESLKREIYSQVEKYATVCIKSSNPSRHHLFIFGSV
jgi:hypothetical protein